MSSFQCPYCSSFFPITRDTAAFRYPSFDRDNDANGINSNYDESTIGVSFYKCPRCCKYSIVSQGLGTKINDNTLYLQPTSPAKQFPDYVPASIRNDYEEACAIVNLSPKASATLSRRCLQGMIRDFWKVSKPRLVDEIDAIKDKVSPTQWKVIDGVRRLGNIGAHMEKDINLIVDIEPDEAIKLLKLIEILIEQWYINRFEQEQLYNDILGIDADKQSARKGN